MAYWLLKSEPEVFSFDALVKAKSTKWDGVRNYMARNFLRDMQPGDLAFYYHSNEGLEIVGIAEIAAAAEPDTTFKPEKGKENPWLVVTVKPVKKLPRSVSRAAILKEPKLKDMAFVKYGRLSVQPVTAAEWKTVCAMGGLPQGA
ncbi:MAG TPA: EVE domain-containing protein [Alphaproteobacteria bacterium]|nr:EVE domain-containing protein [Alphaproteobacteria bacterium]